MAKKKSITVSAVEHSKKVCDPLPDFVVRIDVRSLVVNAYRSGYNKAHYEHIKYMSSLVDMKLSDIDSPVFTHTKEFREHFDYIMSKIKSIQH